MAPGEDRASDSREEMMRATYRALCANGFANLTMQDIADEMGKSRTLLHYHYDTKDELLEAYLDRMIGWLRDRLAASDTEHPVDRLAEFIDFFVIDPAEEGESFALAILEMRLQAIHNETFRRKLTVHYQENIHAVTDVIVDGIDAGVFREVDPDAVGETIYTAMVGARTYQITLDAGEATGRMAAQLWAISQMYLFTDDGRARSANPDFPADQFPSVLDGSGKQVTE